MGMVVTYIKRIYKCIVSSNALTLM